MFGSARLSFTLGLLGGVVLSACGAGAQSDNRDCAIHFDLQRPAVHSVMRVLLTLGLLCMALFASNAQSQDLNDLKGTSKLAWRASGMEFVSNQTAAYLTVNDLQELRDCAMVHNALADLFVEDEAWGALVKVYDKAGTYRTAAYLKLENSREEEVPNLEFYNSILQVESDSDFIALAKRKALKCNEIYVAAEELAIKAFLQKVKSEKASK